MTVDEIYSDLSRQIKEWKAYNICDNEIIKMGDKYLKDILQKCSLLERQQFFLSINRDNKLRELFGEKTNNI